MCLTASHWRRSSAPERIAGHNRSLHRQRPPQAQRGTAHRRVRAASRLHSLAMPKSLKEKDPHGFALAEASDIAESVVGAAIRYTDGLLFTNMDREPHVDTLIAQHVKVQLAVLQKNWSEDEDEKVIDALETMGNGLASLGEACGKHSLHIKMVPS